jgi:hypothetical protein
VRVRVPCVSNNPSVSNKPGLKIPIQLEIRLGQHASLPRALHGFECRNGTGTGSIVRVVRAVMTVVM